MPHRATPSRNKIAVIWGGMRLMLTPAILGAIASGFFTFGQWSYAWLNAKLNSETEARQVLEMRVAANEKFRLIGDGDNKARDMNIMAIKTTVDGIKSDMGLGFNRIENRLNLMQGGPAHGGRIEGGDQTVTRKDDRR